LLLTFVLSAIFLHNGCHCYVAEKQDGTVDKIEKKEETIPSKTEKENVQKTDHFSQVKPILQHYCLKCHRKGPNNNHLVNGGLRLETKSLALQGGFTKIPSIVDGSPEKSTLYQRIILPKESPLRMPSFKSFPGGMKKEHVEAVKEWIKAGAPWPKEETLDFKIMKRKKIMPTELFKKLGFDKGKTDIQKIEKFIQKIPGTEVTFSMLPIPAGTFKMGSADSDPDKKDDELPQHEVVIDSFWMAQFETTWLQYELWQFDLEIQEREAFKKYTKTDNDALADIVSRPTPPYHEMSFGMGTVNRPAICMTQLAAKTYCMWLSAKTGHFYRLPTEAEWEYACRAGATTRFYFGDDKKDLGDYAWYEGNDKDPYYYHEVGLKKPNAWHLHDMLGNVGEWVLDSYSKDAYKTRLNKVTKNPMVYSTRLYPRIVRGGSWDDGSEALRCAAKLASSSVWKKEDPQIPQSVWYHTNAKWVGFRVVCDPTPPTLEDLHNYWPTDKEIKEIPER